MELENEITLLRSKNTYLEEATGKLKLALDLADVSIKLKDVIIQNYQDMFTDLEKKVAE